MPEIAYLNIEMRPFNYVLKLYKMGVCLQTDLEFTKVKIWKQKSTIKIYKEEQNKTHDLLKEEVRILNNKVFCSYNKYNWGPFTVTYCGKAY